MAGGRRPANYVSGARHNSGVERQPPQDNPVSPPLTSQNSASLPLWIPSIWQPAPLNSALPEALPRQERQAKQPNSSSALAAALDSAVQSAVIRALGSTGPAPPTLPHIGTSTASSDTGFDDEAVSASRLTPRELELLELVDNLKNRLNQRDEDVRSLTNRLSAVEQRLNAHAEAAHHQEEKRNADMLATLRRMNDAQLEMDRKQEARSVSLQNQLRASQTAISKLRLSQKNIEGETGALSKRIREVSDDVGQVRFSLATEFEKSWKKLGQLDQSFKNALTHFSENINDESTVPISDFKEAKRHLEDTVETIATMRSRLKRVESQVSNVSKQSNDAMALTSGFEDGIRAGLDEVKESVGGLRKAVHHIQTAAPRDLDVAAGTQSLKSRIDGFDANLKSLKKLIESNLRTQLSAENIVKEQVSLITKHVCVAMRQYTARRISENNTLIDQTLRARIPEYAQHNEQFVLVREEDVNGNESIDIQKTSNPTGDLPHGSQ